ncbi:MAG: hypothetical protein Q8L23_01900 [Caulobacter sp.]|nr:hypothetical protein [Caulobacter sp.]
MRWLVLGVSALVVGLAAVTLGWAAVTPAEEKALGLALARGKLIYSYDQAAWVSTDTMLVELPRSGQAKVAGWIVEPKGEMLTATYYGLRGATPFPVYSADVVDNKVAASTVYDLGEPAVLSQAQQAIIKARATAMGSEFAACANAPFNTVVLPPETEGGPWLVYLLTPQVQNGVYPFGGHFLVEIGANGDVVASRRFTRACMNMPVGANDGSFPGITHNLDPTPTEIHVFLSLWLKKTLYVMTEHGAWSVEGGRIRLLTDDQD